MFRLGVITDEISQDITIAAELAKKHGFQCLEIRSVDGKGPFELTEDDVRRIRSVADSFGLQIPAISSPVYKCDYSDAAAKEKSIEGFRRCAQFAKILGASYIRCFDFFESGVSLEDRVKAYEPIKAICEEYGVTALVEYDPSVHSNTARRIAQLVRAIDSPLVGAVFDPGNGYFVTPDCDAYPGEYEEIRDVIRHIHVKDIAYADGKPVGVKVGDGLAGFRELFAALIRDGYEGCVMLETHYRKKSELSDEQLVRPGGYGFSEGGYEASEESMIAMNEMINDCIGGMKTWKK